jgi:hypothetical protein
VRRRRRPLRRLGRGDHRRIGPAALAPRLHRSYRRRAIGDLGPPLLTLLGRRSVHRLVHPRAQLQRRPKRPEHHRRPVQRVAPPFPRIAGGGAGIAAHPRLRLRAHVLKDVRADRRIVAVDMTAVGFQLSRAELLQRRRHAIGVWGGSFLAIQRGEMRQQLALLVGVFALVHHPLATLAPTAGRDKGRGGVARDIHHFTRIGPLEAHDVGGGIAIDIEALDLDGGVRRGRLAQLRQGHGTVQGHRGCASLHDGFVLGLGQAAVRPRLARLRHELIARHGRPVRLRVVPIGIHLAVERVDVGQLMQGAALERLHELGRGECGLVGLGKALAVGGIQAKRVVERTQILLDGLGHVAVAEEGVVRVARSGSAPQETAGGLEKVADALAVRQLAHHAGGRGTVAAAHQATERVHHGCAGPMGGRSRERLHHGLGQRHGLIGLALASAVGVFEVRDLVLIAIDAQVFLNHLAGDLACLGHGRCGGALQGLKVAAVRVAGQGRGDVRWRVCGRVRGGGGGRGRGGEGVRARGEARARGT